MKKFATALVAACLVAVPASAFAADRETVSLRVATSGVDFARPAAVDAFRANVQRQIAAACEPNDRVGADTMPDFKCRREMAASLAPAVTELAARAVANRGFATN
ncbi:MAG: UrcA family protein [Sphingomonadales bacterium]|nr:UrcA family protein [Sphingomonadales bacterium]